MSNVQSSSGLSNVRLFLGADRVVAFLSSRSLCQGAPSFSPPTWPVVRPCGNALVRCCPTSCWLPSGAGFCAVLPSAQTFKLTSSSHRCCHLPLSGWRPVAWLLLWWAKARFSAPKFLPFLPPSCEPNSCPNSGSIRKISKSLKISFTKIFLRFFLFIFYVT